MKKISVIFFIHLCIIFASSSVFTQDFQTVRDGIEYAKITRPSKSAEGKDEKVVINLLRLDLTKVRLDVVHAMDAAIGLEKTSSIATRHGAFAAINAGFFRIDKSIWEGDDVGLLKIDGRILSESSNNRIALGINNRKDKTEVNLGHLQTKISLFAGIDSLFSVSGINRERKPNEVILLTKEFGRTTLTDTTGTEFVVKTSTKNPLAGNVIKINKDKGSSVISSNHFVISATGEKEKELSYFFKKLMTDVRLNFQINSFEPDKQKFFSEAEDIVTGVPQLIKDGKVEITWQKEKSSQEFVETHHPRTAVAKLRSGKFLMVTIDGRSEESGGMSLYQLADFLLEQGATDAMNLDGGGSTTIFLDGKVVNKPSDKEGERKVGDAILVFPR